MATWIRRRFSEPKECTFESSQEHCPSVCLVSRTWRRLAWAEDGGRGAGCDLVCVFAAFGRETGAVGWADGLWAWHAGSGDYFTRMHAWQCSSGAVLGIEPRTSRTLSENHTTRPNSHCIQKTYTSVTITPYCTRANTEAAHIVSTCVLPCELLSNWLFGLVA